MNDPDTEYDEEKLKERLSKMMGGVYVIRTGGATEVEMMEKKERVEDAILATRSAIVSGIVPGGEVTFLSLANVLKQPQNQDDEYAYRILERAIKKPFEKLLTNAGLNPGYYQSKVEIQPFGHGVDVTDNTVKDMIEAGIVDPAAVLIESLRSAVSVAILLITSDAVSIIVEENDK
jgi:chaperonin GroEL